MANDQIVIGMSEVEFGCDGLALSTKTNSSRLLTYVYVCTSTERLTMHATSTPIESPNGGIRAMSTRHYLGCLDVSDLSSY
jgi:hypothetical protein